MTDQSYYLFKFQDDELRNYDLNVCDMLYVNFDGYEAQKCELEYRMEI